MLTNWCLIIAFFNGVLCFNLDVSDEGVIRPLNSPIGSYFGYSLALHLPKNTDDHRHIKILSIFHSCFQVLNQITKNSGFFSDF